MPALIRLRNDAQLETYMALKGIKGQARLAEAMGVDRSTVSRTLSGEADLDAVFVTALLAAFPELSFNDLFEVTSVQQQRAGAKVGLPDAVQLLSVEQANPLLYVEDVATRLYRTSDRNACDRVRSLIRSKALPARRVGKRWCVHVDALDAFERATDDPEVMRHAA